MPIIELKDVRKTFRSPQGLPVTAVDGVSLSVERGETLGIIGESGSGKSTLGRLILRLIEADSGTIMLEGEDIRQLSKAQLRKRHHHAVAADVVDDHVELAEPLDRAGYHLLRGLLVGDVSGQHDGTGIPR